MRILICLVMACAFLCGTSSAQQSQNSIQVYSISKADSLFMRQQWTAARREYEGAMQSDENKKNALAWNRLGFACYNLGDHDKALEYYQRSVNAGPSTALKPILYGRLAKVYALKDQHARSLEYLQQAVDSGYVNLAELDTAREFKTVRTMPAFSKIMARAEVNAFPCKADAHKREFDFWVGEWDVYATGTNTRVGHSLVQKASGDCMILENWTALGQVPNTGKSMNYINAQTNKWEQLWVGSGGGGIPTRFYDGEYRDSVMQFAFEASSPQGKQVGRFRFFNEGPDQVRQLSETSADGGKTWTTNYDFTYKRRK
jgi:tetratricopeptide (TPR) repeat protein